MVRQLAIPLAYVFAVSILVCSYQAAREVRARPAGQGAVAQPLGPLQQW